MNNLGFILINIDNSSYYDNIFKNIKLIIENNIYNHICIFNSSLSKLDTYNVPVLHLNQAKFFDGDLILFDLYGAMITKNFTNAKRKILYCKDIPWIKNRQIEYTEWSNYYDDSIDFIVSNQYLYDIYEICWKKPLGIMEEFNYEQIQSVLQ